MSVETSSVHPIVDKYVHVFLGCMWLGGVIHSCGRLRFISLKLGLCSAAWVQHCRITWKMKEVICCVCVCVKLNLTRGKPNKILVNWLLFCTCIFTFTTSLYTMDHVKTRVLYSAINVSEKSKIVYHFVWTTVNSVPSEFNTNVQISFVSTLRVFAYSSLRHSWFWIFIPLFCIFLQTQTKTYVLHFIHERGECGRCFCLYGSCS